MERNIKQTGLVNLVVLLAIAAASTVLARYSGTLSGQAGLIFLGLGFLVILIGYFQMRLEETERYFAGVEDFDPDRVTEHRRMETSIRSGERALDVHPFRLYHYCVRAARTGAGVLCCLNMADGTRGTEGATRSGRGRWCDGR